MAIPALPFSPTKPPGASAPDDRRRRLARAASQPSGLAALAQGGEAFEDVSTQPQQIGDAADLALQEPEIPEISQAPEIEQPSLLATERVQRAPTTSSARPLLANDERFGAAVSEAVRGEEPGSPSPGATGVPSRERREALQRFLRPEAEQPDEGLATAQSALGGAQKLASGLRGLASPTPRERLSGAKSPTSAETYNWAVENVLRESAGAQPFTHTFSDPRFPGMEFPSPGAVEGVPSTPIGTPGGEGASLSGGLGAAAGAAGVGQGILGLLGGGGGTAQNALRILAGLGGISSAAAPVVGGTAGSTLGAIGSTVGSYAPYAAAAANIADIATSDDMSDSQKAISAAGTAAQLAVTVGANAAIASSAAASAAAAGLSATAAGMAGAAMAAGIAAPVAMGIGFAVMHFMEQAETIPHNVREQIDVGERGFTVRDFARALHGASTPEEFVQILTRGASGWEERSLPHNPMVGDPEFGNGKKTEFIAALKGRPGQRLTLEDLMMANPDDLSILPQAGVHEQYLDPWRTALSDLARGKLSLFQLAKAGDPDAPKHLADMKAESERQLARRTAYLREQERIAEAQNPGQFYAHGVGVDNDWSKLTPEQAGLLQAFINGQVG